METGDSRVIAACDNIEASSQKRKEGTMIASISLHPAKSQLPIANAK